jgi:hypothetical protein
MRTCSGVGCCCQEWRYTRPRATQDRNMTIPAFHPHRRELASCTADVLAHDNAEHYGCRICDTKLAREKGNHDFGVRWRLI